jgi:hypothetical protein
MAFGSGYAFVFRRRFSMYVLDLAQGLVNRLWAWWPALQTPAGIMLVGALAGVLLGLEGAPGQGLAIGGASLALSAAVLGIDLTAMKARHHLSVRER